jgi:hypothetical protein
MSTFEQLVDRVGTLLHGYSLNTESTTWLVSPATISDTTLTVYDSTQVGRGFIEIEDEILYVSSTNNSTNQITIAPWGRAQRGTSVAAHAVNKKVTVSPTFPRGEIKKAINYTLDAMYPMVFGIGKTELTYVAAKTTYDVPDDVEQILNLTHSVIGPSNEWLPIRAWQLDRSANPTTFGTGGELGKSLSVYSPVTPGRKINVVYGKRPTLFDLTLASTVDQEYATVTGMPSYSEDVVLYGAAFRMISFLDPSRLGPLSAQADLLDSQRGSRSGENASRFLFNIYQTRLGEVAENQRRQYPVRSHYQR